MIAESSVQEVKEAVDLYEVVSDYLTLKKSGKSYSACCPFHEEKTPSFYVTPSLNIYKCFGCGATGDSIGFIMEHEGLSFVEAVRQLAQKYHIELKEEDSQQQQESSRKDALHTIMHFAMHFFRNQLKTPESGAIAQRYLNERNIRPKTQESFQLGFAPNSWEALMEAAKEKGFAQDLLEEAGLSNSNESGQVYDRFRNRLIFPIHSLSGKVIAFGARLLGNKEKGPKYLNSPETPLYDKSRVLYGLDKAKNSIRKRNEAILTEGYMDVISLHQAGIDYAVATSGTSFTEQQARLLKRFALKVTLVYDSDQAGQKASYAALPILLRAGLQPYILSLPEGEDPDSYIQAHGPEAFEDYLQEHKENFIEYALKHIGFGSNDPFEQAQAISGTLALIKEIPEQSARHTSLKHLAKRTGQEEQSLQSELNKLFLKDKKRSSKNRGSAQAYEQALQDEAQSTSPLPQQDKQRSQRSYNTERALLRLLINFGNHQIEDRTLAEIVLTQAEDTGFQHPPYAALLDDLKNLHEEGYFPDKTSILHRLPSEPNSLLFELVSEEVTLSEHWAGKHNIAVSSEEEMLESYLDRLFKYLLMERIQDTLDENRSQIQELEDGEELDTLLLYQRNLKEEQLKLAKELNLTIKH